MALTAGSKLGPYEIVEAIGAGGMGEVYRARDPRLKREVAIKVSAERRLMVASVRASSHGLEFGTPSALSGIAVPDSGDRFYSYDISADGQRIPTLTPEDSDVAPMTVLIDWQAGLRK